MDGFPNDHSRVIKYVPQGWEGGLSTGKGNPEVQSGNLGFEHKKFEKHDTSAWLWVFGARLEVKANFGENCRVGVEPCVEATIVPELYFGLTESCTC